MDDPMTSDTNETGSAQGQKDTRTLYIDYSKCIGCETCEAVCKFLFSQPRIVMVRTVDGQMLPLYCRHCDHPHCMKTCRTGSLTIDEQNAVLLNPMFCRGCQTKSCILGCPYGGVFATGEGVAVSKCDLCASRRKKGDLPACVEMCPTGAIYYVEREDIPGLETDESRAAEARVTDFVRPRKEKI